MPYKSLKPCAKCNTLTYERFCPVHKTEYEQQQLERKRQLEKNRDSAYNRGYDSKWAKARIAYLSKHPVCAMCQKVDRVTVATVVDHIVPHRGDKKLFWDSTNWQPLCKKCHDKKTASGK